MTRDEVRNIIWQELGRVLNVTMTGNSQNADGQTEQIQSMLIDASTSPAFPVAYPWGFASRTPDATAQLITQIGNSPLAKAIVSHFDPNRPSIAQGETVIYNQFGQQVYLKNGQILLGSMDASQPFILGDKGNTFFNDLLTAIIAHTHPAPGAPPTNIADFEAIQTGTIENDSLLSKVVLGE